MINSVIDQVEESTDWVRNLGSIRNLNLFSTGFFFNHCNSHIFTEAN